MSSRDPQHFGQSRIASDRVCAKCFGDKDIQTFIKGQDGDRGCDFCGKRDAPTSSLSEVAEYIKDHLFTFYGKAVEHLPFESAEGGYQGWTSDTFDLLFETVGLEFRRDGERLAQALVDEIGNDIWCERDWHDSTSDKDLRFSWNWFCEVVKHKRRFFFHNVGARPFSPLQFLEEICSLIDILVLIQTKPAGFQFYRARPRKFRERHTTARSLGPPPPELANQSNRMNPPGIPMMYCAENPGLATAETRAEHVSIGVFRATRDVRILNLVDLPRVPGFFAQAFAQADGMDRFTLKFLHQFAEEIAKPVPRNDRVYVDYIPTQVFSEFLRDHEFEGGRLDGLAYRSATERKGANIVLFATPDDVTGAVTEPEFGPPWLELVAVRHR